MSSETPTIPIAVSRDVLDRLVPGAVASSTLQAPQDADVEEFVAGRVGVLVERALVEIMAEANERRKTLLKLLDNVAADGEGD